MIKFKDQMFDKAGFYVLGFSHQEDIFCWCDEPENQYGNVYSFMCITPNTRDKDTCHDFGIYMWPNHYRGYPPISWRKMNVYEILGFSSQLFQFGRPSWAHKKGKHVLTIEEIKRKYL